MIKQHFFQNMVAVTQLTHLMEIERQLINKQSIQMIIETQRNQHIFNPFHSKS